MEWAIEVKNRVLELVQTEVASEFHSWHRTSVAAVPLSASECPALSVSITEQDDHLLAGGSLNKRRENTTVEIAVAVHGMDERGEIEDSLVRLCGLVTRGLRKYASDSVWPEGADFVTPAIRYHVLAGGEQIFTQVGVMRWQAQRATRAT